MRNKNLKHQTFLILSYQMHASFNFSNFAKDFISYRILFEKTSRYTFIGERGNSTKVFLAFKYTTYILKLQKKDGAGKK